MRWNVCARLQGFHDFEMRALFHFDFEALAGIKPQLDLAVSGEVAERHGAVGLDSPVGPQFEPSSGLWRGGSASRYI